MEISCLSFSIYGKKYVIQILFPAGIFENVNPLAFCPFVFLCVVVPATCYFCF